MSDIDLAEKLRHENPDQFNTLVRMHLSFVLDLNTDEADCSSEKKPKIIKWNLFKKQKSNVKNIVLSQSLISQVQQLMDFLRQEDNITQEGIFRKSGNISRQQELKSLLQSGVQVDLHNSPFSVHDCASVLKNCLAELPESVLTELHYPAYCQIAEYCDNQHEKLLVPLQLLLLLLPIENRNLVQQLIELLHLAASYEQQNKMSANNLAKLFTPHLLCPKRLSAEAFHANSQTMSKVVEFMIQKGEKLFDIPTTLATDIRVYWDKKERRRQSPMKHMNESVCDGTAANTVFTFVDREKSQATTNPTETALAELYAHIQSLPESSKKKKLIKQFNKENGCGTPLHASRQRKHLRAGSLGDSIKKHLPGFSKTSKVQLSSHKREILGQLQPGLSGRMPSLKPNLTGESKKLITPSKSYEHLDNIPQNLETSYSKSCENLDSKDSSDSIDEFNTTKLNMLISRNKRKSPDDVYNERKTPKITDETPRIVDDTRQFNENMMTPRSRKPVISLSGTDLCELDSWNQSESSKEKSHNSKKCVKFTSSTESHEDSANDSISSVLKDYLYSRSLLTASPVDLSFSSRTDDYVSTTKDSFSESSCQEKMSASLLYCLDGNDPEHYSHESVQYKRLGDCSSEQDVSVGHVHETAL